MWNFSVKNTRLLSWDGLQRYGLVQKQGPQICKVSMGKMMSSTMGFYGFWGCQSPVDSWIYPLVNVYIAMERSKMLLMGKLTIPMASFNSFFMLFLWLPGRVTFHSLTRRHVMWGWIGASITGAWSLPGPAEPACPVEEVVKLYEDALAFNELQEGSWCYLCEKHVFFSALWIVSWCFRSFFSYD